MPKDMMSDLIDGSIAIPPETEAAARAYVEKVAPDCLEMIFGADA